jgi:hypothetical protein
VFMFLVFCFEMHPRPEGSEQTYRCWLLGICFLREASERAIESDRSPGKWGLARFPRTSATTQ